MRNKVMPRVATPGDRRLATICTIPRDLNPSICKKIYELPENDRFARTIENCASKLHTPQTLAEFRVAAVKAIKDRLHIRTVVEDEILVWDLGVYRGGGRRKMEALCQNLADDWGITISNAVVTNILGQIKRSSFCEQKDFDRNPMQISVRNGILNLETMTLRPHDPDFLTLVQIPWDHNPEASCPLIEKAVEEIVGERNIPLTWEIFGHFLIKDYRFKRFPIFVGKSDCGKSTLLHLMTEFLGNENVSAVSLQNLNERFMKAELKGKLANISDDLPKGRVRDSSMLKRLTGESCIQAEEKGKDPFSYTSYAKLVFSSNYLPKVDDPTDADFGRFMIIQLTSRFGDRCGDIKAKPKDPTLLERLLIPEEMSGLLNKALEGIKRLKDNNWEFSYGLTADQVAMIMQGDKKHAEQQERNAISALAGSGPRWDQPTMARPYGKCFETETIRTEQRRREWVQ